MDRFGVNFILWRLITPKKVLLSTKCFRSVYKRCEPSAISALWASVKYFGDRLCSSYHWCIYFCHHELSAYSKSNCPSLWCWAMLYALNHRSIWPANQCLRADFNLCHEVLFSYHVWGGCSSIIRISHQMWSHISCCCCCCCCVRGSNSVPVCDTIFLEEIAFKQILFSAKSTILSPWPHLEVMSIYHTNNQWSVLRSLF